MLLETHPHLFKVVTPIDLNYFEELLTNHPNKELVSSFCHGLRHGFWLFADTNHPNYPSGTITHSHSTPNLNKESIAFLKSQCDGEMLVGHYSESFSPQLLPGMVAERVGYKLYL